ncbi:hypothetical protein [Francisella salimarina]|uniref:hypothetical protein n=1 Tax=Francisella salimarina TaxID=2599927 RepID=UPI003752797F
MHLTNNYDHYAGVLNKYQLVETTSTIVEPDGQTPIKYELVQLTLSELVDLWLPSEQV